MKVKLSEFNAYLESQIGQPYLWGGQHTKLTPQNYTEVIDRREEKTANRKTVKAYCAKKFKSGATVLYAYDCSGLGMYYLENVKKIYPYDLSANGMMGLCKIVNAPKCGYWVFRLKNGRAVHIGYMVSDTEVIHAKGRAYGVCKERYTKSAWDCIGIPKCVENDIPEPEKYIFTRVLKYGCVGNDVIELKKLLIAHGFDKGITTDTASSKKFGSATRREVKKYQKSVKLKSDGIAGYDTITKLGGVWCG